MARVKLDYSDITFVFSTELQVRFADINAGWHLGNDNLVTLLGEARSLYLNTLGLSETGNPGIVVSDLVVQYKAEGRLRDVLRFDLGVTDRNRYGADIVYRVVREADDTVIALAKTGIVFFDYAPKSVVSAPPAFAG